MSAGVLYSRDLLFTDKQEKELIEERVGGLVEPFSFGTSDIVPAVGLQEGAAKGVLVMSEGDIVLDMGLTIASSSWAPGTYLASMHAEDAGDWSGNVEYWSPAVEEPAEAVVEMVVADGGGLQVDNLVSFVQRQLTNIVLVSATSVPLQMRANWNPFIDELTQNVIDFDIPAFFGLIPTDLSVMEIKTYDLKKCHIFPESDFPILANRLQQAQTEGNGIVVSMDHVTIANEYYGIPAGVEMTVTWVYLGRLSAWEAQLSEEMQRLVVPGDHAEDLGHTKDDGEFKQFPNYATTAAEMNPERSNLLADLCGWTILQNADLFTKVLS